MRSQNHGCSCAIALGIALAVIPARSQDSRTVSEPSFPAVCSTLSAALTISAGEPSSETAFDTSRIQAALNACPSGQAVELTASGSNDAFLLQPISIPTGRTLIVDGGVTVFGSRNPADYQNGTPSSSIDTCGSLGTHSNGCLPLIQVGSATATTTNIGLMGYGVINGRGGDKLLVNGTASTQSWWDVAATKNGSNNQNNPILVADNKSSNFTIYKITLVNAPEFHITNKNTSGLIAWGIKIATPYNAYNTDGIQTGQVTNVTATNSWISDGDDDFVTTATTSSPSNYLTFSNSHVGSGHGASVSAAGGPVSNMLVSNISFSGQSADGNEEAIHLKGDMADGGVYTNIAYQNICVENVHHPLRLDPFYSTTAGTNYPQFVNISVTNFHALTEGQVGVQGYDASHITTLTLNNVVFDVLNASDITPTPQYATITLGPGEVYPARLQTLTGTGVTYSGSAPVSNASAYSCTSAFPLIQGELYATTAASSVGFPASASVTNPATFTLSAVVEPLYSQTTYTNPTTSATYTGAAAPSAAVKFYEGATLVGTGALSANGTLATTSISNATAGAHTYTATYAGDGNYPAFTFGSVTVTVSAGPATQLAYATPPPASLTYGVAPGTVKVALKDVSGSQTTSTATVTLTVTNSTTGYSTSYTVAASAGVATFTLDASLPQVGTYMYTASATGVTSATASETVTQATLVVTANPASRVFDSANPAFTATISGFVNGDSSSVVTGTPVITTSAPRNAAPGNYSTVVSQGSLAATNYNFQLIGGMITVSGGAAQAILFAPLRNLAQGRSYQLTARTTSGLIPTYAVTGPASSSGGTLTITGAGSITVTASSAATTAYAAAPGVSQTLVAY